MAGPLNKKTLQTLFKKKLFLHGQNLLDITRVDVSKTHDKAYKDLQRLLIVWITVRSYTLITSNKSSRTIIHPVQSLPFPGYTCKINKSLTASGFFDWPRISSKSSLERK